MRLNEKTGKDTETIRKHKLRWGIYFRQSLVAG
jgi:hypothetical protein